MTCTAALLVGVLLVVISPANAAGGLPAWTNFYTSPSSDEDYASALAVDRDGNVFVTGWSGYGGHDAYVTVAYSGAGLPLWTNRYNSPALNPDSRAHALAITINGSVVVAGASTSTNTLYSDWATVAYSTAGVPLWTNRYHGPGNGGDAPRAAAADNTGNVYVTGSSTVTNGYYVPQAYTTIAYSGSGAPLWTNYYSSSGISDETALAVAVDREGNAFVTGSSATVAYSGAGLPLWTNRFNWGGSTGSARAIAVDFNGNVFVTGYAVLTYNPVIQDWVYQYGTVAYSGVGVPLWTNLYNGTGNAAANFGGGANAIAVDSSGKVFVTGYSYTTNGYTDYETVAYSGAGVALWTNHYGGPGGGSEAKAIAVDSAGNVFVTGSDYHAAATVAYSGTGVPLWTNRYRPPNPDGYGEARAIAVDGRGNVFVTGGSVTNGLDYEYITIKYSSSITPIYLAIDPDGSGGYFIRYTGVPGSLYHLQRTVSLAGTWSDIATNTAPASGLIEFHESIPPSDRAFYRAVQP